MKIGIYGGSFNPPHLGHQAAARAAVEQLGLDRLLIIPAGQPPHKQLPAGSPPAEDRLELTRIAADGLLLPDVVSVSDMELRRSGKSYTVDTLKELADQYPGGELWLLMGTDMFLTLTEWHDAPEILRLAGVAAFGRTEGEEEQALFAQRDRLLRDWQANVRIIPVPGLVEISSTQLRQSLESGERELPRQCLAPSVYGYILRRGLYGARADLKHLDWPELRACSYSMVYAKRLAHIRGIEEESVRLARRWGADEDQARTAAILHDCTKYLSMEEQLALCSRYQISLDPLEQRTVKLLHAKTGAWIARDVYGVSDPVFEAIYWHTTGKGNMTLLEKIIYLADYMEPSRSFEGVERLRELACTDLDAAVLLGLDMTAEEMERRGKELHPRTLEASNWLKGLRA